MKSRLGPNPKKQLFVSEKNLPWPSGPRCDNTDDILFRISSLLLFLKSVKPVIPHMCQLLYKVLNSERKVSQEYFCKILSYSTGSILTGSLRKFLSLFVRSFLSYGLKKWESVGAILLNAGMSVITNGSFAHNPSNTASPNVSEIDA